MSFFISSLTGAIPASLTPTDAAVKAATDAEIAERVKPMTPDSVSRSTSSGIEDYYSAITRFAPTAGTAANPSTEHLAAKPGVTARAKSVADMTLAEKVSTTAHAGMASAAKETGGALKTALSDPKTQVAFVGTAAVVAGAQFVPGLDVAVDASLGTVGVGKLKDYSSGPARQL